jgi:Bacterial alpha-L-rhamnosidase C-terminal domain
MSLPPEELTLTAARNARILLDHGFTSANSAGALGKRIEPALKAQIDSGWLPGPRLIASSVERAPPSDGTLLDPGKVDEHGAGRANVAAFVKGCKDISAKAVKFLISGGSALKPGASMQLLYTEEELMAAGVAARENDVWLTGHAHAAQAVGLDGRQGGNHDLGALERRHRRPGDELVQPLRAGRGHRVSVPARGRPLLAARLGSGRAHHDTAQGRIASAWGMDTQGRCLMELALPNGLQAHVALPGAAECVMAGRVHRFTTPA